MSIYATNEYIISSNNSMNDNKYNSQKAAKSHKIKSILKPLLRMLRKSGINKKQSKSFFSEEYCVECDDNSSNEELESKIFDEITECSPDSAIFVCNEDGQWNVAPISKGQAYVPVHFARTQAGTFFWTTVSSADSDVASPRHCYTECQDAAQQIPMYQDRWVQA